MNFTPILWQPLSHCELPNNLLPWITHAGSFMQRLETAGIHSAKIKLLNLVWQAPMEDEKKWLQIEEDTLIREVIIHDNQFDFMFARSVFPAETLTGEEKQLAFLEDRSSGSILFNNKAMERSEFEIAYILPGSIWHEKLELVGMASCSIWARRSSFKLAGKKLLLTEFFLPAMEHLC